jgi:hypothetical protein
MRADETLQQRLPLFTGKQWFLTPFSFFTDFSYAQGSPAWEGP